MKLETRELEVEKAYNSKLAVSEADYSCAVTYFTVIEDMLKRMSCELERAWTVLESQQQELWEIRRENNTQKEAELFAAIDLGQSTAKSEVPWGNTRIEARKIYETKGQVIRYPYHEGMEERKIYILVL